MTPSEPVEARDLTADASQLPTEGSEEALGDVIRSAQGRCITARCPSRHVGDAPDCLAASVSRLRFALRADTARVPEGLREALERLPVTGEYVGLWLVEQVDRAAMLAALTSPEGGSDE